MNDPVGGHPRSAETIEYVIGTLSPRQREAFERQMDRDPALVALVRSWRERLKLGGTTAGETDTSPGSASSTGSQAPRAEHVDAAAARDDTLVDPRLTRVVEQLARLRRSCSVWRRTSYASGALAACLALFVVIEQLRHAMHDSTVLIAAVNRAGDLPALIVRIDPASGSVQVRPLAAETPAGRSLEMWAVVEGAAPRSLGTLDPGAARARIDQRDRAGLSGATLAVSVEPTGGSPSGVPTGPVVYSGRLVAEPR